MLDGYTFMESIWGTGFSLLDLYRGELWDFNDDSILDYEESKLYNMLIDKGVSVSKINQIMKLYEMECSLSISDAEKLSTDELRDMVKRNAFSSAC